MLISKLKLSNIRGIEHAEFTFQPGFNLLIGVNGAGKTTILDAMRVVLRGIMAKCHGLRGLPAVFIPDDIRLGSTAMSVECEFLISGKKYGYLLHKPREAFVPLKEEGARQQVRENPEHEIFSPGPPQESNGRESGGVPFSILFSTRRALASDAKPWKSKTAGGVATAFSGALSDRELRLQDFADWMLAQKKLAAERTETTHYLRSLEVAVTRFLPECRNLRVIREGDSRPQLLVDKEKRGLNVRQLSDGERSSLSLVLDLTRRLAQANPAMKDPAAESTAVVLIDEIDLHLHPKWQRDIVKNLLATFPKCQFIATTHSPQIIGEVEHDRIQIIADGHVYSPDHSYGVDSSRVLEEIMDSSARATNVNDLLSKISNEIGGEHLETARTLLAQLAKQLGDADPEVTRIRTLINFVEGKE